MGNEFRLHGGNTHYLSWINHKLYNLEHNEDADDEDIHGNVGESVLREELSKKGNIHGLCGQNPGHLVSCFLTHSNSNYYKWTPEQCFAPEGSKGSKSLTWVLATLYHKPLLRDKAGQDRKGLVLRGIIGSGRDYVKPQTVCACPEEIFVTHDIFLSCSKIDR